MSHFGCQILISFEIKTAPIRGYRGSFAMRKERQKNRYQPILPWQCLNFLPEPQGQGALRGVRGSMPPSEVGAA
jgi:hypothetical protein